MINKYDKVVIKVTDELEKLISLMPESLIDDFREEAYVAGGCIYSLYNNEEPKDYDVFIRTLDLKMRMIDYFKNLKGLGWKFVSSGAMYYGTYNNHKLLITNNAITIDKYQIVLKDIGEPEEVVGAFDFLHNMYYVDKGKLTSLYGNDYLETKNLFFNNNRARDIVSTIIRTTKFIERGFKLSDKELCKMLLQLHKTGFSEEEVNLLTFEPTYTSFGSGK